ncbi:MULTISPECIES: hypothetical protein [Burkholderia cepacia complex]|uniref:hypothetical protein n=1 Tax=Burkholderia cepacia complex TaxID=87882 RepID=UPI00131AEC8D|nr:hypothetical protein [Burkholderia metallica]
MNVPLMMSHVFCKAFERAFAIHDGDASADLPMVMEIRSLLTAFYREDPGPYETALVTVATEIFADEDTRTSFLTRVGALFGGGRNLRNHRLPQDSVPL